MKFMEQVGTGLNEQMPRSDDLVSYIAFMNDMHGRKPFITTQGYVGIGPEAAVPGDMVVIFAGGKFPYVIREHPDPAGEFAGTLQPVVEAYVHGVMYGEFLKLEYIRNNPDFDWTEITLE